MVQIAVLVFSLILLAFLLWERWTLNRARAKVSHVIHVNGIRGKSTLCRLIDSGLRAGGYQVFCKTTGTDPMTIGVDGTARPIRRRGRANIKEQVATLRQAADQRAQVLVIECMAVDPRLQRVAQDEMLRADIGVITNVRRDHTDVMGETLEEICNALAGTIPRGGTLFTGEADLLPQMARRCAERDCQLVAAHPDGSEPRMDFPENIALALAVCLHLGVEREVALAGMAHYQPDPYALSVHRLGESVLVNAMSANDLQSTLTIFRRTVVPLLEEGRPLVVLINSRADRGARTKDMLTLCETLTPQEIWLLGANQNYLRRKLERTLSVPVRLHPSADQVDCAAPDGRVIFAVGNIAGEGKHLMARAEREGTRVV